MRDNTCGVLRFCGCLGLRVPVARYLEVHRTAARTHRNHRGRFGASPCSLADEGLADAGDHDLGRFEELAPGEVDHLVTGVTQQAIPLKLG